MAPLDHLQHLSSLQCHAFADKNMYASSAYVFLRHWEKYNL